MKRMGWRMEREKEGRAKEMEECELLKGDPTVQRRRGGGEEERGKGLRVEV